MRELFIQFSKFACFVDVDNAESREEVKDKINSKNGMHYDWFLEHTGDCNWVLYNTDAFEIIQMGLSNILHYKQDCGVSPTMPFNGSSCYGMFSNINLSDVPLAQFSTANVINMAHMFEGASGITTETVEHLTTDEVEDAEAMFADSTIEELDVSSFNTKNLQDASCMFAGCEYLETLYVIGWDLTELQTSHEMFRGCSNLSTILAVENWESGWTVDDEDMFLDCFSLPDYDEDAIGFRMARTEEVGGYFTYAYQDRH